MPASVGRSAFGELRGVEQFVSHPDDARLLMALFDFVATLPNCYRPTVNEGNRSRPRQLLVYEESKRGGPLAATPFNSTHDEIKIGNAVDLGGPNGEVLSAPVLAALRKHGPDYGVFPTGMSFGRPELWHWNIYRTKAVIRPSAITTSSTKTVPLEDDEMASISFVECDQPSSVWHGSTGYYTDGEGFVVTSEGAQGRGLYEAKRLMAGVFKLKVEREVVDENGWTIARAAERPDPAVLDTGAIAGSVANALKAGGSLSGTAITEEVVAQITAGVADVLSKRLAA